MKIAIITHKEIAWPTVPYHFPLLVGAYKNRSRIKNAPSTISYDDTEENISTLNNIYNELTGHYWMWKNIKDEDYYGLCHYRRYFNFNNHTNRYPRIGKALLSSRRNSLNSWTAEMIMAKINDCDIVVAREEPGASSEYPSLKAKFEKEEEEIFNMWVDCVKDLCPEYLPYVDRYVSQKQEHMFNAFIMKHQFFEEYSRWLFDILFLFEKKIRERFGDDDIERMCGYIGEHLLNVYLIYKKDTSDVRIKVMQMIMFYNTDSTPSLSNRIKAYGNSLFTLLFPYGSRARDFIKFKFIKK